MLALSVAPMLTDRAFAAGTALYIEREWNGIWKTCKATVR